MRTLSDLGVGVRKLCFKKKKSEKGKKFGKTWKNSKIQKDFCFLFEKYVCAVLVDYVLFYLSIRIYIDAVCIVELSPMCEVSIQS